MGVPAFYKWLVNKYPRIVVDVKQNEGEFDNLYIDMNGIIHPCFHPDDHPSPPTTFDDVFNNIYEYVDHIFNIVRPRNLLYLAIDGVAPRAKMNQQRSRRFRTAKDTEIAEAEELKLRKDFEAQGKQVLPKQDSQLSDSNIITPGTEFMFTLSKKLQDYISLRMNTIPAGKGIQVILSDASVPGEGEHKIISFIRQQRTLPDYNSNTRHCLYGLDADLIMLALATHEVHFSILREDVLSQEPQSVCLSASQTSLGRAETTSVKLRGWFRDDQTKRGLLEDDNRISKSAFFIKKPYQFLHVWILREYLELDMKISDPPENFTFDIERIIDDFIFMCFFVGNDFLPRIPNLEIHERAIDLLMTVYKKHFKNMGGYLVDMQRVNDQKNGHIILKRVEKFISWIGTYEEIILKKRSEFRERKLRNLCKYSDGLEENELDGNLDLDVRNNSFSSLDGSETTHDMILQNTNELKEKLKARIRQKSDLLQNGGWTDKVKLGIADWKKRYYKEKFFAEKPCDIETTRKEIVQKYTEGLLWVLEYYFSAVPSWNWFYPYHYVPFASDLKGLAKIKVKFQKGSPFKPFDQLMGVLPSRSAHALPKAYHILMTDENSRIIDFYPTEFEIDTDGKRYMWQGICKLPFIDEERLLAETKEMEKELKKHEADRNVENVDKLFVRRSSSSPLTSMSVTESPKELVKIETGVRCLLFELPKGSPHIPRLLEGVQFPSKTITEEDIVETQLWHEHPGSSRCTTRRQAHQSAGKSHNGRDFDSSSAAEWKQGNYCGKSALNLCSDQNVKVAGSGWGAGRGRGKVTSERAEFSASGYQPKVSGNQNFNWAGRGKVTSERAEFSASGYQQKVSGNQNFNRAGRGKVTSERAEFSASGYQQKVSGNQNFNRAQCWQSIRPYGKAQSMNNNSFWPSGNGITYKQNMNNVWRQSQQLNANSWGQSNRNHSGTGSSYSADQHKPPFKGYQ